MAAVGQFKNLNQAIIWSLWNEPNKWIVGDFDRFLLHADGVELVKPVVTNRWVMSQPIGYIRLSWWTQFHINAMVHGGRLTR